MRRHRAALLAAIGLAFLPAPARPAEPSEGGVSKAHPVVAWSGHFRGAATLSSSAKEICTDASGKPPAAARAAREKTTLVPQQNIAPMPSLPRAIAPKNRACWLQAAAGTGPCPWLA